MAAPKRVHESEHNETEGKRSKSDEHDIKLSNFLSWCKNGNLTLNEKVRVGKEGSTAQYGMVAVSDIEQGECLFEIPRSLLLTPETSQIAELLKEDADSIRSDSGWVPLLLALLYEYTHTESKWSPYFRLVPDFDELDLPMFWPRELVASELEGTGVVEAVERDLKSITKEFNDIVLPFVRKHKDVFHASCSDLDLYKKMVAFVMAYSFTEHLKQPGEDSDEDEDEEESDEDEDQTNAGGTGRNVAPKDPVMMVPMADILNHVAKNNAHLDFGKDSLKMTAVKPIKKGEEVYNTYGCLGNADLLHMYGFSEPFPDNHFDTVDIPHVGLLESLCRGKTDEECTLLREKCDYLSTDLIQEDGFFTVGHGGILTEDEMSELIYVLTLNRADFDNVVEKGTWTGSTHSLNAEDLWKLPQDYKDCLCSVMEHGLSQFKNSLGEEEKQLAAVTWSVLSRRDQFCVRVRHGQMKLLQGVMDQCRKAS